VLADATKTGSTTLVAGTGKTVMAAGTGTIDAAAVTTFSSVNTVTHTGATTADANKVYKSMIEGETKTFVAAAQKVGSTITNASVTINLVDGALSNIVAAASAIAALSMAF